MRTDIAIEIVVVAEKSTGVSRVEYISDFLTGDQTMDIFVSDPGKLIALYRPQAYENPLLKTRRAENSMLYPGDGLQEKMILVGQVRGQLIMDLASHIEVSRAHLHLQNIPIDEV